MQGNPRLSAVGGLATGRSTLAGSSPRGNGFSAARDLRDPFPCCLCGCLVHLQPGHLCRCLPFNSSVNREHELGMGAGTAAQALPDQQALSQEAGLLAVICRETNGTYQSENSASDRLLLTCSPLCSSSSSSVCPCLWPLTPASARHWVRDDRPCSGEWSSMEDRQSCSDPCCNLGACACSICTKGQPQCTASGSTWRLCPGQGTPCRLLHCMQRMSVLHKDTCCAHTIAAGNSARPAEHPVGAECFAEGRQ